MKHEPDGRDDVLGRALRDVAAGPERAGVDWPELSRSIHARASSELSRRRWRHRAVRVALPLALAASFALFLVTWRAPDQTGAIPRTEPAGAVASRQITVDELLDTDVSEVEFRAMLFGATEAEDLLLIAAEEDPR